MYVSELGVSFSYDRHIISDWSEDSQNGSLRTAPAPSLRRKEDETRAFMRRLSLYEPCGICKLLPWWRASRCRMGRGWRELYYYDGCTEQQ
jgi:hypothetical protein